MVRIVVVYALVVVIVQNTNTNNLFVYGSPEAGLDNHTFIQSEN